MRPTSRKPLRPAPDRGASPFPTTLWSRLRPGRDAGTTARAAAFETLARRYDRPIRAFLRTAFTRGEGEAEELAQGFFLWAMETRFLEKADPSRGRFRAFLKVALRHYVADARRRRTTRKQGGDRAFVPLRDADSADLPLADPAARSPEEVLDAEWRAGLVHEALSRSEKELASDGREAVFAVFRDYFLDPSEGTDYRAVARRRGLTPVDVSNYLTRAKRVFRAHLRDLVLETVRSPEDLDEELRWLLAPGGR